jgi:hypothetical protein
MEKYVIFNAEMQIVNIVVWDGDLSTWQPPAGCTYVLESDIDITTFTWHGADSA